MVTQSTVTHKLSLAVRLINSVTGGRIRERNVVFHCPGTMVKPVSKGDGVYLFINTEREDFELEVSVYGYEPAKVQIKFEEPQENYPIREIYLIPEDTPAGGVYLTLRGCLKGISAIEAVSLDETVCSLKDYENRRQIMTIANPKNVRLSDVYYALLNSSRTEFEIFEIVEQTDSSRLKIAKPLAGEWKWNDTIARIIPGRTDDAGNYLLRVVDTEKALYLVHYVVNGKDLFQTVDLNQPEELTKGGKRNGDSSSKRS